MAKPIPVDVSQFGDEVSEWALSKIGAGGVYNVERATNFDNGTLGGYRLVSVHRADGTPVEHVPRVITQILIGTALSAAAESGGVSQIGSDFELVKPAAAKAAPGGSGKSISRAAFEALSPGEKSAAISGGVSIYD